MKALLHMLAMHVWLVPALPLLAVVLTGVRVLLGRAEGDAAEGPTARLASLAALLSLGYLLLLDVLSLLVGPPGHVWVTHWFGSGNWAASLSFLLDPLSLAVGTVTALIGWLVTRFSVNYLHREPGFHRFFIVLGFFLAGMQWVLLAGNGLLAFVGWEMCGVASFLLIGYAWQRPLATGNALFAFVTNRAGDAGFLLALGLAASWLGGFEWTALSRAAQISVVNDRLLLTGFVIAALAKSAQLPFSAWVTRALEGPTPSSTIFYGAVMIHAGVFLLLRVEPLLLRVPDVMLGLVVIGMLTAIYAWLCGLVQTDVKSALIFGTLFQVSLMFVAIGLGWTKLALVHLCLHACWRAWQFLVAPSWLVLSRSPLPPPPTWLRNNRLLYTIALQRFWLDKLAQTLLVDPTLSFARDVKGFETHFVDPVIGQPGRGQAVDVARPLVCADGVPGRLLGEVAAVLQRIEDRLLLQGRGGAAERGLRQAGAYLRTVEHLLEQPRYLMMAVMATFVVIL